MITLTSKDLTYLRALVEAETIVATKKQEIIDTRGSVELVEQYNQERVAAKKSRVETIKAEQAAYLEGLVTKVEEEGYIITNSALKAQVEALRVEKAVKEASEVIDTVAQSQIIDQSFDPLTNTTTLIVNDKKVTIELPEKAQSTIKGLSWWERVKSYIRTSADQLTFNDNRTGTNLGGTIAELSATIVGVDAPLDIRDLVQSVKDKDVFKGVVASASLLPVVGVIKLWLKQNPSADIGGKIGEAIDNLSTQLKVNFDVNGSYVTPEGFRVRVEDAPNSNVHKSVGDGGGLNLTPNGNPAQFAISKGKGTTTIDLGDSIRIETFYKK